MKYGNILLVDDDEEDREIFLEALSQLSFQVNCQTSSNAAEALKALDTGTLKADIIFLDLHMTPFNGQEFLSRVKSIPHLKDIPVFMISTHSGMPMKTMIIKMGAADYITKPNNFTELVKILETIL